MVEYQIVDVQQGIWMDERWLRSAGLGARLQVVVQPGEIRLRAVSIEEEQVARSEAGWEVFRLLGQDAPTGRFSNAAADHDQYLYGIRQTLVIHRLCLLCGDEAGEDNNGRGAVTAWQERHVLAAHDRTAQAQDNQSRAAGAKRRAPKPKLKDRNGEPVPRLKR